MDHLKASLLDLLFELKDRDIPIMIGGGYGLFLKRQHLVEKGVRTLFERLPHERSTRDLDMFLRAELLADVNRTRQLADTIRRLGYTPVPGAECYQWSKSTDISRETKIDVLVGPLGQFRNKLVVDERRARPKGKSIGFHAHPTEEAISLEDYPIEIEVTGVRSTGDPYAGRILVPEAFPYLTMKLHAFADRKERDEPIKEREHAFDVYMIVAMMTEPEYDRARKLAMDHAENACVQRAREISQQHFSAETSMGILRIREHDFYRSDFQMADFRQILAEIFG